MRYASGGSVMKLDSNKLTSLDAAVFQPIVNGFIANGYSSANTFISIANSKNLQSLQHAHFKIN